MKKFYFIFGLIIFSKMVSAKWPDRLLHMIVCDVGQGDAILFSYGYTQLLIDTGPDEQVLSCLEKHMPTMDKKIDVLLLTHFDDDHIGGFQAVSEFYQISYIFLPLTDFKKSEVFLELKERLVTLESLGTIIKEPFLGQQIAFSSFSSGNQAKYNSTNLLQFGFLTPFELTTEEYLAIEAKKAFMWQKPEAELLVADLTALGMNESTNDGSVALFVTFGQLKLLLTADLESSRELALLDHGLITKVDLQKVGHHGSKTSSTLAFLEKIRPEISLISCGLNNKFAHPHEETLATLRSIGSQVLRTDQLGDLEIVSDGLHLWFKEQKRLPFLK